ncbi:aminotransferase class III-fold pyridoxal phosphate-dependent enzyme [Cellulomonas soli]|uniref:aminotransferase class III-fold pyridoxal phosphate-dependent enzyme n=1 Tax=Cellulomonas soli TaxID=931535 RepID=UPI003F864947
MNDTSPCSALLDTVGAEVVLPDVVSAQGCVLRTRDGRELVDLEAGVWCTPLGHHHPAVDAAVRGRSDAPAHTGYRWSSPVVQHAARRLCEIAGLPDGRALLLSSGSEAVELAVRISREVTGRELFVRLGGHYLSAYGTAGAPGGGRWTTTAELAAMEPARRTQVLRDVAAFVLEPGNASGLVDLPDPAHVQQVCAAVRANGGLVVVDEVTTGFGRTGAWFGYEHLGITPDVVAIGKGCGNGYPVSAVVAAGPVAQRLAGTGLRYAQSHQNDPAGAAVVLAVIRAFEQEDLLARACARGAQLLAGLSAVAARSGAVGRVRGRGLLCAFDVTPGTAAAVQAGLLAHGYLVGAHVVHDTIRVYPPLVISEQQVEAFVQTVEAVVAAPGAGSHPDPC